MNRVGIELCDSMVSNCSRQQALSSMILEKLGFSYNAKPPFIKVLTGGKEGFQ